jgi:hypothetical protein
VARYGSFPNYPKIVVSTGMSAHIQEVPGMLFPSPRQFARHHGTISNFLFFLLFILIGVLELRFTETLILGRDLDAWRSASIPTGDE